MSEIKSVCYTWMALNNFKCNHLMPLHFKGLIQVLPIASSFPFCQTTFQVGSLSQSVYTVKKYTATDAIQRYVRKKCRSLNVHVLQKTTHNTTTVDIILTTVLNTFTFSCNQCYNNYIWSGHSSTLHINMYIYRIVKYGNKNIFCRVIH